MEDDDLSFHREVIVFSDGIQGMKADACQKTTHLAIGAHQDDVEIMAMSGILECFGISHNWFSSVTLSTGTGKNRKDIYRTLSDDELKDVRVEEQKKAAIIGNYAVSISMKYQTQEIRMLDSNALEDIKSIILMMKPRIIFMHSPFDNYDTHVAACILTLKALQEVREEYIPERLLGCEVWGSLDWLPTKFKVYLPVQDRENIINACMGVYDSQIYGGKRYDLGVNSRLQSNAVFSLDSKYGYEKKVAFAINLKPLIWKDLNGVLDFIDVVIDSYRKDVLFNLKKILKE